MRVVATADFHGRILPEIPECDLLVYAGDVGEETFAFGPFADWLLSVPARYIVGIAGNHDWWSVPAGPLPVTDADSIARHLPWTYLYNEAVDIEGLVVWGSPFTNNFMDWAYMGDERELDQVWATMPEGTQMVVTHGPPYGCCDRVVRNIPDRSVGSKTLRERLVAVPSVQWVVCGHIHEGYGSGRIVRGDDSVVNVYNVSALTESYLPKNKPIVLDIEVGARAEA